YHRRSRRASIIAARRASGLIRSRVQVHQREINSMEIQSSDSDEYSSDSETDIVMQHFNSMRNRPVRRPSPSDGVRYDEIMDGSDDERLGVQDFNSPNVMYPLNAYQFKYTDLMHENNYTCPHLKYYRILHKIPHPVLGFLHSVLLHNQEGANTKQPVIRKLSTRSFQNHPFRQWHP
ncbi:unnamed protein product, partial [Pylaiella littoralis]